MPQTCTKCVLSTEDKTEISFNESGICNYCSDFLKQAERTIFRPLELLYALFMADIELIKKKG